MAEKGEQTTAWRTWTPARGEDDAAVKIALPPHSEAGQGKDSLSQGAVI